MGEASAGVVRETPLRMKEKQVWDALEGCEENALTIHGKGGSFQDFVKHSSKEEVMDFFEELNRVLTEKGIEDYHLVLKNEEEEIDDDDDEEEQESDDDDGKRRGSSRTGKTRGRGRRKDDDDDDRRRSDDRDRRGSRRRREDDDHGRKSSRGRRGGRRRRRSHSRSRSRSRSPRQQQQRRSKWKIVVYHGGEARENFSGPIEANRCMSCDLRTSMMTGLTGEGEGGPSAYDSLIYEDEVMRYWHDAKGRALFVITPLRHVRDLKELTREELYHLWTGVVQVMKDMHLEPRDLRDIIVNGGKDQNHAHLHLKIRVNSREFERARRRWSSRRNRLINRLREFADAQDK